MRTKTLLLLTAIGLSSSLSLAAKAQVPSHGTASPNEERDILRSGGLRAAAKRFGHYVTSDSRTSWAQYNLHSLAESSDVIVEASPTPEKTFLSSDGQTVYSQFHLQPIRFLKPASVPEKYLTVIIQGGEVVFEDGTSAELRSDLQKSLVVGGPFLFFLKKSETGFVPVGRDQGVIAIDREYATVVPQARSIDPITSELRGLSPQDLLERVERIVAP